MCLLSAKHSSHLPRRTHCNMLFQTTRASWGSDWLSGRRYCSCPSVKITAQNIQLEMQRRKRDGICGQARSFCPVLFTAGLCDRAFHLLPSPPAFSVARGSEADLSTGASRGPGVRNVAASPPAKKTPENGRTLINCLTMHLSSCSQRVVQDQLCQHHLVPPKSTESKTLGVGPSVPTHS